MSLASPDRPVHPTAEHPTRPIWRPLRVDDDSPMAHPWTQLLFGIATMRRRSSGQAGVWLTKEHSPRYRSLGITP